VDDASTWLRHAYPLPTITLLIPYKADDPISDFRNFLKLAWKILNLPKPTRRQLGIAKYLQYAKNPRRMVKALRGVGKSWIAAAYAVWALHYRKDLNVVVVSGSKAKADQFTTFALRLIMEIPVLRYMMPREGQRSSMTGFDVAGAPPSQTQSLVSMGVTGQMTGNRADILIADDVETPNNSDTQTQREKLAERIKEFEDLLKPGGEILFLGTPQTEDSIYNRLPGRGYDVKVWPAEFPNERQRDRYGSQLAPDVIEDLEKNPALVGHTTEPRFSDAVLMEKKLSQGQARYALQYMLDTSLADVDRYPLKLSDLIIHSVNPEKGPEKLLWARDPELAISDLPNVGMEGDRFYRPIPNTNPTYLDYTGCIMAIDPAGRGQDETAYAVVAYLHGILYLLDAGAFKGYGDTTMEGLAKAALRNKVRAIRVEDNFGDGMFAQLLKPHLTRIYPVLVEDYHSVGQKEKRIIDTLEPVMSQHRLVVDHDLVKRDYESVAHLPIDEAFAYRLFYQMTRITSERKAIPHDDRIEAVAMAVAYWVEQMARDVNVAAQVSKDKLMLDALKHHIRHALGHKKPKNTSQSLLRLRRGAG
jgi:hypothetical protein